MSQQQQQPPMEGGQPQEQGEVDEDTKLQELLQQQKNIRGGKEEAIRMYYVYLCSLSFV